MDPTGGGIPGVLPSGRPDKSFQTVAALPTFEDMLTGPTGKIVAFTLQSHPWIGPLAVWGSGDKGSEEFCFRSLCTTRTATSETNFFAMGNT